MIRAGLVIILISVSGFLNCSSLPSLCVISPPKINLTGEKTAIERQIVGDYKELEKNSWIISSVKTTVQRSRGTGTISSGDIILIKALKVMDYHKDKIRNFKKSGALGERNNGFIKYMKISSIENNKNKKETLLKIIQNENSARKIIFSRSVNNLKNRKPTEDEITQFGKIFADEQRALAQKNDWVQLANGRWEKK